MNRRCAYTPLHRAANRCPNRATVVMVGPSTGRRVKVCGEHVDVYRMNHWRRADGLQARDEVRRAFPNYLRERRHGERRDPRNDDPKMPQWEDRRKGDRRS